MKKLIVVILSLILVLSLVACGGSSDPAQPDATDAPAVDAPTEAPTATGTDLSKVDYDIAFGDFDGMQAFMSKLGNFEAENAVVKVDGSMEKLGSSYSIMERDGDGAGLGVTVVVEDWADADYPADGSRVQILGVVVTDGWNHYISVLPENLTVAPEN